MLHENAYGRPPLAVVAALGIALTHEIAWLEAAAETGSDWPASACVETCVGLVEDLGEKLPEAGAEYVWGVFVICELPGGLLVREHAWLSLGGGAILDPTAGQYLRGSAATQLVLPSSPLYGRYVERERGLS